MSSTILLREANLKTAQGVLNQHLRTVAVAIPARPMAMPVEAQRKSVSLVERLLNMVRRTRHHPDVIETRGVIERPMGNAYDHSFSGNWMVRL